MVAGLVGGASGGNPLGGGRGAGRSAVAEGASGKGVAAVRSQPAGQVGAVGDDVRVSASPLPGREGVGQRKAEGIRGAWRKKVKKGWKNEKRPIQIKFYIFI